jgi:hypothetical protein
MAAWLAPVLGAVGLGVSMFGQAKSTQQSNKNAKKQVKLQHKVDKENYKFQWDEDDGQMWRKYAYDQETVNLQRQNSDIQLALTEQTAMDQWSYGMTIRDFNHNEKVKVRNQQVKQANQQVGFNAKAFSRGLEQQENWLQEQNLAIDMQKIELDSGWIDSADAYNLNQANLDTKQRGSRAINQLQIQATSVEGLKAEGSARASGQSGRSGAKSVQAAIAENGAKQAVIAEQTTQAGEQYALSTQQNVNQLNIAYKELFMKGQQLSATRNSLNKKDMLAREELNQQFKQANANALNKIMLNPTLAPDLPTPPDLDDYKPVFQDPFEPEAPPEPRKGAANTQSVMGSMLNAGAAAIPSLASAVAPLFVPKGPGY